ncbi:MAG: glycosyltransferase [Acidobacteriota bacterium]
MRVLQVIPSVRPESGGTGRSISALCTALANVGVDTILYAAHAPGDNLTIEPGSEAYEVKLFSAAAGRLYASYLIFKHINAIGNEFDLIHLHSIWNPIVTAAAAAARKSRVPYVLSPHGMLNKVCLKRRQTLKRVCSALYERNTVERAVSLQFSSSNDSRDSRVSWFNYPEHFLAPNGIDLGGAQIDAGAFRKRFPELADKQILLFLGRLHSIKGLNLQFQAFEKLIGKYPNLRWVLIGPDDGEWERVDRLGRDAGLDSYIRWLGPMLGAERFDALAAADVVLQSSFYECHSMTINEALAVGAPLVITDTANFDAVQRIGAGYVVPRDPLKFATAIDSILQSPEKAEQMRKAGRQFAEEELNWSHIATRVKAAYTQILSGSGKSHSRRE